MNIRSSLIAVAFIASGFGIAAQSTAANAMSANANLQVPAAAEAVACRTSTTRVVMPNGRVKVRTVRKCGVPAWRTERWQSRHHGRHHPNKGRGVMIRVN